MWLCELGVSLDSTHILCPVFSVVCNVPFWTASFRTWYDFLHHSHTQYRHNNTLTHIRTNGGVEFHDKKKSEPFAYGCSNVQASILNGEKKTVILIKLGKIANKNQDKA